MTSLQPKQVITGTESYKDGLVAPKKDERYKTEDVTQTKGRDFEDFFLKRELLMGIFEKGFEKPSPVQEEAIPIILQNRNVLARAKNGTGKTAAYIIPCLEKTDTSKNHIQVLILIPTRELALQTSAIVKEIGKHMDPPLQCMVTTGGTSLKDDIMRLYNTVHMVVATPGRILDLASKNVADLSKCRTIIMDEADKLLSPEFQPVLEQIIGLCDSHHQICLFSATFPVTVKSFCEKFVEQPYSINLMDELTLRGITQFYDKKSISHFVPNQQQPWNAISNTGNPTKSKEVHSLLKAIKRKEVRGLGAPSQSDRAFTLEEYDQCLRIMDTFDDERKRYLYPAITKFQFHMIGRIDDSCYTFRQYLQRSDEFPFALTIRMRWSKNVFEERDAPPQIVLASMNSLYCVHLALAVYLELFLERGEDGNGGSIYLFNFLGCKGPKEMNKKVQKFWADDVLCHQNFHKVKAGNLGSHSVKKRATTRARASGCKKDNVDYRARWKDKARQQDRYTEYELAYPDAEVAGVLCHGGPCEYVLAERCQISNDWIIEHVTPNINRVYGNGVATVLGKALLWGVCAQKEDCAITIPDRIRRRVAEAYSILMPEHQVHDKIDQVVEKKLLVISNHEEAVIIQRSLELTNIGIDGEDSMGRGSGGETSLLLATHFQKLEDMERKLLQSHNSDDVHYATINQRLDRIERNVRRISMVPFRAAPLQQASSSAHHQEGNPGSVPCPTAREASDELHPASGHNPSQRLPTFQASLMPNPRDLYILWHEYEFGVGGRKAAKEFTSVERGRVKFKYCRRKIIWDCIHRMVRSGHTSDSAIDKIYEVYGRSTNVSTIIERMRVDNRAGGHPALK